MKQASTRLLILALVLALAVATGAGAQPKPVTLSGTVVGFDTGSSILTVNTRLGPEEFLLTNTTLIILNDHTAATTDIQTNDQVTVTYNYTNATAIEVHLFREATINGVVTAASAAGISVRLSDGSVVTLKPDANSAVALHGIALSNLAVLLNRHVNVIYEPGTFLLLSLAGQASSVTGKISTVDTTANTLTVTLANGKTRTFPISTNATVLRNGLAGTPSTLVAGDHVVLAFANAAGIPTALAIQARGAAATGTGSARRGR